MTPSDHLPPNQCQATNKEGFRCGNKAMNGSTFCQAHDPAHREITQASIELATKAHVKSISKKRNQQLNNLDDLVTIQKNAILDIARKVGKTTKDIAAIAALSNSLLRTMKEKALVDRLSAIDRNKKSLGA